MIEQFVNLVAKMKINKANSSSEGKFKFAPASTNVDTGAFVDAVKLLKDFGISIFDGYHFNKKHVSGFIIIIDDEIKGGVCIRTPFEYAMSRKTFMKFYYAIIRCGVNGRIIIRALSDSLDFVSDKILEDLSTCCDANNVVSVFVEYIETILNTNGYAKQFDIDKSSVDVLCSAFGGYKGIRTMFIESMITVHNSITDNNSIDRYVKKNKCLTCKHGKVDMDGYRYCDHHAIAVPQKMSALEIQETYRDVYICDDTLYSRYTPFPTGTCEHYRPRTRKIIK